MSSLHIKICKFHLVLIVYVFTIALFHIFFNIHINMNVGVRSLSPSVKQHKLSVATIATREVATREVINESYLCVMEFFYISTTSTTGKTS